MDIRQLLASLAGSQQMQGAPPQQMPSPTMMPSEGLIDPTAPPEEGLDEETLLMILPLLAQLAQARQQQPNPTQKKTTTTPTTDEMSARLFSDISGPTTGKKLNGN